MVPMLMHHAAPPAPADTSLEAQQCQERIQCLEKALGFMQAELDRLQGVEPNSAPDKSKKRIQYDKITVWPKPTMGMIEDWVNGNFRPKPLPRTASSDKVCRAQSVAPHKAPPVLPTANYYNDRANSAPPAPPQPFIRRFVYISILKLCVCYCTVL